LGSAATPVTPISMNYNQLIYQRQEQALKYNESPERQAKLVQEQERTTIRPNETNGTA
jgi:hypothetical protein